MNFKFKVNISDQDYLDYNTFWMLRAPYGKKQIKNIRIIITAFFAIFILISLFLGNFSANSFLSIIPLLVILLLTQIFLNKYFVWSLKGQIKTLKKRGKMAYSPDSVIEFLEDNFIETTPDNKTEQKYFAIERVSIVDNKTIYIHINNVMAYILPLSCFESKEQYDNFLNFISTKCANIDIY